MEKKKVIELLAEMACMVGEVPTMTTEFAKGIDQLLSHLKGVEETAEERLLRIDNLVKCRNQQDSVIRDLDQRVRQSQDELDTLKRQLQEAAPMTNKVLNDLTEEYRHLAYLLGRAQNEVAELTQNNNELVYKNRQMAVFVVDRLLEVDKSNRDRDKAQLRSESQVDPNDFANSMANLTIERVAKRHGFKIENENQDSE